MKFWDSDPGSVGAHTGAMTITTGSGESDPIAPLISPHWSPPNLPGLLGEIYDYFIESSYYQVPAVAFMATLAFMAGLCGRTYNVSGTGLNLFLVLLAPTGTGKEGAQQGISRLIDSVMQTVPSVADFIGPSNFGSGQGLIRTLEKQPAFLSILGEFGHTLKMLSDPRAPAPVTMLLRVLLDLFAKSGRGNVLHPTAYSEEGKNTSIIQSPSVSFLAESTAETVYGSLGPNAILNGFLPRCIIVEHKGVRPYRNPNGGSAPSTQLVKKVADLTTTVRNATGNRAIYDIPPDADALELFNAFEKRTTDLVNAGGEIERHLWSRAWLNAAKISGLIAIGCNHSSPIITSDHAALAIKFVEDQIEAVTARFSSGDIGSDESRQEADIRRAVTDYYRMPVAQRATYQVPRELLAGDGLLVVPYGYLRRRAKRLASFNDDPRGLAVALDRTLREMVKADVLAVVPPQQGLQKFRTNKPLYCMGRSW